MHMWMWFGYNLGEFMFSGLNIVNRWSFALTWIALFIVAFLFEGSKVFLAKVQRDAHKKLYPFRSDERRNLLCDRERGAVQPSTSRNAAAGRARGAALRTRLVVNGEQSLVFVAHNVAGYLLMLAVMGYNAHLLLAAVLGMMMGYFLFGTKLTRLQMQCFGTRRAVICTPECDDTAESSTPPQLDSAHASETDLLVCRTRACLQPAHYLPAPAQPTCHYGASRCPSKVARAASQCRHNETTTVGVEDVQLLRQTCCKELEVNFAGMSSQAHDAPKCCHTEQKTVEDVLRQACCKSQGPIEVAFPGTSSQVVEVHDHAEHKPGVEDAQLLPHECCKKKQESGQGESFAVMSSSQIVQVHDAPAFAYHSEQKSCGEDAQKLEKSCCKKEDDSLAGLTSSLVEVDDSSMEQEEAVSVAKSREASPQITCCSKLAPSESQEQIVHK